MSDEHHHGTSSDHTSKVNAFQKHLTDKPLLSVVYAILVILITIALFKWAKTKIEESSENANKEKVGAEQHVIQKTSESIINSPLGESIKIIPPYTKMVLSTALVNGSEKALHYECNDNSLLVEMLCTGREPVNLNAGTDPNTKIDRCPELYFTNSSNENATLKIIIKKRNNGTIQ